MNYQFFVYPKRAGGNPKSAAFKAWKARLKDGVTPEAMLAGVKLYSAYCRATGNTGTQYVKQVATFFGPDRHFEESWQTPSAPGGGRRNALPVSGFSEQDYGCITSGHFDTQLISYRNPATAGFLLFRTTIRVK